MFHIAALTFSFLASASAQAQISKADLIADLHQLKEIIAADYGPLEFKEKHLGLKLEDLSREYEDQILASDSNEDLSYLLMKFVARFRDSHFSARAQTKAESRLGFTTELLAGKVVLDEIDRSILPFEKFRFSRGDELVSMEDKPILEIAAELQQYFGSGNEASAFHLAVYSIPHRLARILPPPHGNSKLVIRHRDSGESETVILPWISSLPPATFLAQNQAQIGINRFCSEDSQILAPPGSEILREGPFTAFMFPTSKGLVGFLRIPHYYPVDPSGNEVAALRFSQYEKTIKIFEEKTVALIIDQTNNCGGSILYANKMLSLFLRQKFRPAEFEFRASATQIEGLSRQLAKFSSTSEGYVALHGLIEEIKSAKAASLFATKKLPLRGLMEVELNLAGQEEVEPNEVGYSKPILMLINELAGSGGDLFPALMKDLGRATLMGQTTMGAGGHAWNDPKIVLSQSHLSINLTRSLFYRPRGDAIENAGVEPDISYLPSMADFLGGYENQLQTATRAVLKLAP